MVASIRGAIARTLVLAIALVPFALPRPALAAESPIEGRLGLMGFFPHLNLPVLGDSGDYLHMAGELEIGPRDGWWSLGGARFSELFVGGPAPEWTSTSTTTFFGRLKLRTTPEQTWSALVGWNDAQKHILCFGSRDGCSSYTPYGLLVGAAWTYRTEHVWLQLTPQYTFPLFGERDMDGWMLSMVPWAEAGWRITPNLGAAFRLGPAPFKLTLDF